MTSEEALARVHEWEREHGHRADLADASLRYGWDLGEPRITSAQQRDGAEHWADYCRAMRRERLTRRSSEIERIELFRENIERLTRGDL
ncbi:MAG: hypothetical protein M3P40_00375 [Actinomycetota bacterium]|nr:hypothetical protein [Actinomycetota bacterium]